MIGPVKTAGLAPRRRFISLPRAVRLASGLQAQELAGRAHKRHHKAAGERPYHRVREALQHHGGQSFRSVAGCEGETVEIRLTRGGSRAVARRSSAHVALQLPTEQVQQ